MLLPERFDVNLAGFRSRGRADATSGCGVYFAKKANKAAMWVRRCAELGAGVDVASCGELRDALGHGVRGENLVVTGPAKSADLLRLAVLHGALLAVDALDELARLIDLVTRLPAAPGPARILLRCPAAGRADEPLRHARRPSSTSLWTAARGCRELLSHGGLQLPPRPATRRSRAPT